jgi:hypothetical protein
VSPGPVPSTYALSRKRKIDQTEHVPRDEGRSKEPFKNNICNECRQIDFDKIIGLGSENRSGYGVLIQKVGKRFRQQIPTDCLLCQILLSCCFFGDEESKEPKENGEDELRAYHFLNGINLIDPKAPEFYEYRKAHPLQCLAIVPSSFPSFAEDSRLKNYLHDHGCAVVYHDRDLMPEIFAVQNVSAQFDSSLVVSWLQYCSRNHKRLCSKSRSVVGGLKLIDCESLAVKIARPEDIYVALSYVWGSSDSKDAPKGVGDAIDNAQLPPILPAVISDAVKVTKLLGFRYLWIDKFCIDQDDPDKKHDQIKQMGFVYENAELAIIAAAGPDENYGLPGVGTTPRKAQLAAEIGNVRVLSTMQHPHSSIRSSKWSTRGCTFQEAMLSRRRLVFTNEQVYFECNAMNCYESVSIPLHKLHIKNKSKQRSCFRAGVFGRNGKEVFGRLDLNTLTPYRVFVRYLAAIEEYSSRELRYDQDSLNALIGVTQKFEKVRYPYLHIWGVPYPSSVESGQANEYFVNSLTWVHSQDCWENIARPRRRNSLPSWAWSGWAGKVSFPLHEDSGDDKLWFHSAIGDISFECESERILEFTQMVHHPLTETTQSSSLRVLVLHAYLLPSKTFSYNSKTNTWMVFDETAKLHLSQGPTSPSEFWRELQEGGRWQCIIIGSWFQYVLVMILDSHNGFTSRAGMFYVKASTWGMVSAWVSDTIQKTMFRIE